jgi:hypothetical protein
MDPRRFEALSRRVGAAGSRRAAVMAAVVGVPLALGWRQDDTAAGIPIVHCKVPGKRCDKDKKCCSGNCRKNICTCAKKGRPCWAPLEGALCCSQRCSSGKCK